MEEKPINENTPEELEQTGEKIQAKETPSDSVPEVVAENDSPKEEQAIDPIPETVSTAQTVEFEIEPAAKLDLSQDPLLEKMAQLQAQMETLETEFQSKLKYDAHKEKIIDKLHHELQVYKDGLIEKLLRPIFMDVIEVVDDTRKMMRSLEEKNQLNNTEKLLKMLKNIPGDLEDMLYRHGVEVVEAEQENFDPSFQKVVKVETTEDTEKDKKIAQKIKNGYRWEGKLIRHEMVTVFKSKSNNIQ